MDQPNLVVPRPYALAEPTENLEISGSLDLTPERPVVKRSQHIKSRLLMTYLRGVR